MLKMRTALLCCVMLCAAGCARTAETGVGAQTKGSSTATTTTATTTEETATATTTEETTTTTATTTTLLTSRKCSVPKSEKSTTPSTTLGCEPGKTGESLLSKKEDLRPTGPGTVLICEGKAKNIVLAHAGVKETEAKQYQQQTDTDTKPEHQVFFRIGFVAGDFRYFYELDAKTGDILYETKTAYDGRTVNPNTSTTTGVPRLSSKEAQDIALKHAGVSKAALTYYEYSPKTEDGAVFYEIDFGTDDHEYDYEIDGKTGDVLRAQRKSFDP